MTAAQAMLATEIAFGVTPALVSHLVRAVAHHLPRLRSGRRVREPEVECECSLTLTSKKKRSSPDNPPGCVDERVGEGRESRGDPTVDLGQSHLEDETHDHRGQDVGVFVSGFP